MARPKEADADVANCPDELPPVATPKQTAKFVHATEQSLAQDRYLKRGLPYVKYGGRIRYLREDILAYMEANRVSPGGADHGAA